MSEPRLTHHVGFSRRVSGVGDRLYLTVRRPYQPGRAASGEGSTICNKPHDGPAFLSERQLAISDRPPYALTGKAAISKPPDRTRYSPKNKHLSFGRNHPCKRPPGSQAGWQSRAWPPS